MAEKALADREAAKARTSIVAAFALLFLLLAIISISIAYYIHSRKLLLRKRMNAKYATDLMLYTKATTEIDRLKKSSSTNQTELEKAEKTLTLLKKSIQAVNANMKNTTESALMADSLKDCESVRQIKVCATQGQSLTNMQWAAYSDAINAYLPHFPKKMEGMFSSINIEEIDIRITLLALLNLPQKQKALLLGITPSNLSMRRKRLYEAVFGMRGTAKDFDQAITNVAFAP